MTDLRYPVGKFAWPESITPELRAEWLDEVANTPANLRALVSPMNEQMLATPYRPGGWTVRQVIHHVADSHMNSYVRYRLALTEDEPTIKPYEEHLWAELSDAKSGDIAWSLTLLESLHARWVMLMRSLTEEQWKRTFWHPALGLVTLEKNLALYAWHGRHHAGHVALVGNGKSV
jgi:hypothetical protein